MATELCTTLGLNNAMEGVSCAVTDGGDLRMVFDIQDGVLAVDGDIDLKLCPTSATDTLSVAMDLQRLAFADMDLTDELPEGLRSSQNLIASTNNERHRFGVTLNPLDTLASDDFKPADLEAFGLDFTIEFSPALIVTPTLSDTTFRIGFEAEICALFDLPIAEIRQALQYLPPEVLSELPIAMDSINAAIDAVAILDAAGRVCNEELLEVFGDLVDTLLGMDEVQAVFGDLGAITGGEETVNPEDIIDGIFAEAQSVLQELGSWEVDMAQLCTPEQVGYYQVQMASLEYVTNAGDRMGASMAYIAGAFMVAAVSLL